MNYRWLRRLFVIICSISFIEETCVCYSQAYSTPAVSGIPAFVSDHPYRADVKATWSLALADGQVLTAEVTGTISRDQLGNVREEASLMRTGLDVVTNPSTSVNVYTVKNSTESMWHSGSTTALTISFDRDVLDKHARSLFESFAIPKDIQRLRMNFPSSSVHRAEHRTESLGTKSIGGMQAEGTRFAEIIPADALGSKQAVVTTRDIWISPDLEAIVMIQNTDPLTGTFTLQVSNVTVGPQNESLFQIPQGYTEKSITPPSGRLPDTVVK